MMKKFLSLTLAMIIFFSVPTVFFAYEQENDLTSKSDIVNLVSNFEEHYVDTLGLIVNHDIVYIQGIPILFVVYKDSFGTITEVTYILDENQNRFSIIEDNDRDELEDSFIDEMINVSNERMYNLFGFESNNYSEFSEYSEELSQVDYITSNQVTEFAYDEMSIDLFSTFRPYNAERFAIGSNNNASVQVWFHHNFDTNLFGLVGFNANLTIRNGAIRGVSRFGNTDHIALKEEITRDPVALSFSFPWSIGATINGNTQTWSSGNITNTTMVTRHRPTFSGTWMGSLLRRDLLTIKSSADIARRNNNNSVDIFTAESTVVFSTW